MARPRRKEAGRPGIVSNNMFSDKASIEYNIETQGLDYLLSILNKKNLPHFIESDITLKEIGNALNNYIDNKKSKFQGETPLISNFMSDNGCSSIEYALFCKGLSEPREKEEEIYFLITNRDKLQEYVNKGSLNIHSLAELLTKRRNTEKVAEVYHVYNY